MSTRIVYIVTDLRGPVISKFPLIIQNMDRRQYQIHIITFLPGEMGKLLERDGLAVEVIPFRRDRLSVILKCSRRLKELQPNIVHTVGQTANVLGRIAAIAAGVPVIMAAERNAASAKGRARLMLDRLLAPYTNYVVSNSLHSARFYIQKGILPPEKSVFIPTGVDMRRFPESNGSVGGVTLGALAIMRPLKNYPDLLQAFAKIAAVVPDARLEIAGDGPSRASVEAMIDHLGIQRNVTLRGWVTQVADFLGRLDIYLHAAHFEGTPNALLEAMACGLPCVAYNTTGCAELIRNEETGLLVPTGDAKAMAQAALTLVNDGPLAAAIGQAARKWIAQRSSIKETANAYSRLYDKALGYNDRSVDESEPAVSALN